MAPLRPRPRRAPSLGTRPAQSLRLLREAGPLSEFTEPQAEPVGRVSMRPGRPVFWRYRRAAVRAAVLLVSQRQQVRAPRGRTESRAWAAMATQMAAQRNPAAAPVLQVSEAQDSLPILVEGTDRAVTSPAPTAASTVME